MTPQVHDLHWIVARRLTAVPALANARSFNKKLKAVRRGWEDPEIGPPPTGMLAYMRRTTVKLPDDLDARLRHEAERRGTTVSEVTREAIEAHLGGGRTRRRLLAAGAGASGRTDVSERIEEILAAELAPSR